VTSASSLVFKSHSFTFCAFSCFVSTILLQQKFNRLTNGHLSIFFHL
jgi:hypothetical protein